MYYTRISGAGSWLWRILDSPSSGRLTFGTVTDQTVRNNIRFLFANLRLIIFRCGMTVTKLCHLKLVTARVKQLPPSNSGLTTKMRRTNRKLRYEIWISQTNIIMYRATSLFAAFDNLLQTIHDFSLPQYGNIQLGQGTD